MLFLMAWGSTFLSSDPLFSEFVYSLKRHRCKSQVTDFLEDESATPPRFGVSLGGIVHAESLLVYEKIKKNKNEKLIFFCIFLLFRVHQSSLWPVEWTIVRRDSDEKYIKFLGCRSLNYEDHLWSVDTPMAPKLSQSSQRQFYKFQNF